MKKYQLLWVVCGLLALAGCTNDADDSVSKQKGIELKNFSNTGCKSGHVRTRSDDDARKEVFKYSCIHEGYLYVTHQNALFNCCPEELGADISVEDNQIKVGEFESFGECNCICPYDLSYEIGPLTEGETYIIYIGHKGDEPKVAEFEFHNSMSGIWESNSEVEIYKYEENPKTLEGTWHLAKALFSFGGIIEFEPGDVTVTFNPNHTIQVINRSETKEMKPFMDSGFYSYEIISTDTNKYDGTVYTTIDLNSERCSYWFNDGMMTLDYGMAYDAPGYFFKKLVSSN